MEVTVEELPSKDNDKSPVASARSDVVAHYALNNRFNITSPSKEEDSKLAEIWAYAKGNSKSDNIPDIVWEVIHLEGVIGSPKLGESRLDKLYKYCKLRRQEAQIQSEMKNVVGSHNL
jgi:hypothetical protein